MRANPITVATMHGLLTPGPALQAYLGLLALQAVVLAVAWPKSSFYFTLVGQNAPNALLAVLYACAAAVTFTALKSGAEEQLPPSQPSVLEWCALGALSPGGVSRGILAAQFAGGVFRLLLALPLIVAAIAISPGTVANVVVTSINILVLASAAGVAGAALYIQAGTRGTLVYLSVRAGFAAIVLIPALLLPEASLVVQSYRIFVAPGPGAELAPTVAQWFELSAGAGHTERISSAGVVLLVWHIAALVMACAWLHWNVVRNVRARPASPKNES